MPGWGKLVAGTLIGVVGTVYATNEELRKKLPGAARDLPVVVRRRFESAISAGRAASSERRRQILRDLEQHGGGQHAERGVQPVPEEGSEGTSLEEEKPPNGGPTNAAQPVEHSKRSDQEKQI